MGRRLRGEAACRCRSRSASTTSRGPGQLEAAGVEFGSDTFDSGVCHIGAPFTDPGRERAACSTAATRRSRTVSDAGDTSSAPTSSPCRSRDLERSTAWYRDTLGLAAGRRRARGPSSSSARTSACYLLDPTNIGREFHGAEPRRRSRCASPTSRRRARELEARGRRVPRRDVRHRRLPHGVLRRPRRQRADAPPPLRALPGRAHALMQVEQVDFVSVPTRDIERCRRRATATCSGYPASAVHARARSRLANVTPVVLGARGRTGSSPSSRTTPAIALRVADVAAARSRSSTEKPASSSSATSTTPSVCHMGFFKDPDGNVLILHRRYAPRDIAALTCSSATASCPCRTRRRRPGASRT